MARNEDLYPSATALGRLTAIRQSKPPRQDFLHFCMLDGRELFYEYRYISSIELTIEGDLVIHCNCGSFENITLVGVNLRRIAPQIASFSLSEIREDEHPQYAQPNEAVVLEVEFKRINRQQDKQE